VTASLASAAGRAEGARPPPPRCDTVRALRLRLQPAYSGWLLLVISPAPQLFAGFKVYLHGDFILPTPPKEDLERLLTAGGAKILTRRPPPATLLPGARAAKEMVDTSHPIVIYDPTCVLEDPANAYIKGKRQAYEATWLLNCISCFSTTDHCVDS